MRHNHKAKRPLLFNAIMTHLVAAWLQSMKRPQFRRHLRSRANDPLNPSEPASRTIVRRGHRLQSPQSGPTPHAKCRKPEQWELTSNWLSNAAIHLFDETRCNCTGRHEVSARAPPVYLVIHKRWRFATLVARTGAARLRLWAPLPPLGTTNASSSKARSTWGAGGAPEHRSRKPFVLHLRGCQKEIF